MAVHCIIGGGGFIGLNLARHLSASGGFVRTYGRPCPFRADLPVGDHRVGEFDDTGRLAAAVEGCDVVYHLIGPTSLPDAERLETGQRDTVLRQTLRLLDLARRGAFRRLVFLSSGGTVYGVTDGRPVAEDAPQWPICSYGVGKLAIERHLHVHHVLHGLDYRIARVSNPFGPYQRRAKGQGVVAALIEHGLRGTTFPLLGDGRIVRDYVPVGDVVVALRRLGDYDGEARVFNIGSGTGRSLTDMIGLVEQTIGRPIAVDRRAGRALDVPVNVLDIGRARSQLGWSPEVPLEDGLRLTADWVRAEISEGPVREQAAG
ncbi:MAG: NAD-dependent epimerase/dehydratase family protein [Thalassobaculum sp.]|uniref:NAD-dependent epimerase/dehydratase family protein n=1 Tax=Thalassobaculum sp. TaxID=2022740 RepID=UPI0032EEFDB3